MKEARNMGRYIQEIIKNNHIDEDLICYDLGCTLNQWKRFLHGRMFMSFESLSILAQMLNVFVQDILQATNQKEIDPNFSNQENKEKILDIIDQYMDICEILS